MNTPDTTTIAEIELALPRPADINSTNRNQIRRWLTAYGIPYSTAGKLTVAELSEVYNNNNAAEIRALETREATTETKTETKTAAPVAVSGDAAAQLGAALAALMPKQSLDAEAVREIVRQEAGLAPVRVILAQPHRAEIDCGTQHRCFPSLLRKVGAGCHVWLAGPAGTGKTTAAQNVAKALELPFYFNGAIDSEHKLLGFTDAQGRVISRPFRQAFQHGGVYLFDEVDASLPSALLAFNAALANGHCDFPDGNFEKHKDFRCIAAANTFGHGATHDYVGRAKMDAAFLDRFVSVEWGNDETLERHIALANIADQTTGGRWISHVQQCRAKAAAAGLKVVISPRASINGCKLLQAGEAWAEAENACIRKGMALESWKQLTK